MTFRFFAKFAFTVSILTSSFCVYAQEKPLPQNRQKQQDPYLDGAVQNTIHKKILDLQKCYLEYLKKNIDPSNSIKSVQLDWQISPNGRVIQPELVLSTAGDPALPACLVRKIKSYRFPPPPTSRNFYVSHTFQFKKEEPAK